MIKHFSHISVVTILLAGLVATPVFARETTDMNARAAAKSSKTVNVACIQAALDKRENSLIAAVDAEHTAVVAALKTRQTALKNAWSLTDGKARRAAIKTAWKDYQKSLRQARESLKKTRRMAWSTFTTESKACRATATDDTTTSTVDNDL